MPHRNTTVVFDHARGFWRLSPVPSDEELGDFYGTEYYAGREGRAPDVKRLEADADEAAVEREWRNRTIYPDVAHYLSALGKPGGRIVDVGCGTGEFVSFLSSQPGWAACGVDLSGEAVALASRRGIDVVRGTITDVGEKLGDAFDVVTMFNLLEHVPDPERVLVQAHELLAPDGLVVVQVPNDFSVLQLAVQEYLDVEPWWVAIPDHINYFDFDSLEATLSRHGFEPAIRYGTFPMELFLVAGFDYVGVPSAGAEAHRLRCAFEMGVGDERRRALAEHLGSAGLGRNAVVVAARR